MEMENLKLSSEKDKQPVSARVNKLVSERYKNSGIPISLVIEAGLIHFLKLDDQERLKFLAENMPDNVEVSELNKLSPDWKEWLKSNLGVLGISGVTTLTLIGIPLVGAIPVVYDLIQAFKQKKG